MYLAIETAMVVFECNRAQAIRIFKVMDRQGVAKFRTGRRGWPTRLESN